MNNINLNILKKNNKAGLNIITIASGKGGVGKTWLASTMADCLGKKNKKVLLFDGDLGLANIDVQLGINPERDISGLILNKYTFDEAVYKVREANFELLAGISGSGVLSSLNISTLRRLKNELIENSKKYDYVILDLAAGIDSPVRSLTIENGEVYVITTSDPTSLTDAYAFIKLIKIKYPKIKINIVINMVSSKNEGLETYQILSKSCSNFLNLKIKLAGIIRYDRNVNESIKNQKLFLYRYPISTAAKDIHDICEKIIKHE
ncbi:MAG: Flagellum site-determining protein YlxH [Alphaproteobacteria bacterium MarineAlpha2_Bin1]|nr:MAG: Flagellum site-determining protein YlxH [Alphaproteobacteria bacterium MarineAlpha2_Bin1]|tara:strand:+ start:329 stop:1117 length:789 start_codon:yes stop_codon:yes gene_type:complete